MTTLRNVCADLRERGIGYVVVYDPDLQRSFLEVGDTSLTFSIGGALVEVEKSSPLSPHGHFLAFLNGVGADFKTLTSRYAIQVGGMSFEFDAGGEFKGTMLLTDVVAEPSWLWFEAFLDDHNINYTTKIMDGSPDDASAYVIDIESCVSVWFDYESQVCMGIKPYSS